MSFLLFFGLAGLFGLSALLNFGVFIYSWIKYHKPVWPIPLTATVLILLMVVVFNPAGSHLPISVPGAWNFFFAQTPLSIAVVPTLVVVAVVAYTWSKYRKQVKHIWLILSTASILVMFITAVFFSMAIWTFAHNAG
jgi:multisubunit Na+/H+ antiporter MnhG subunit